MTKKRRYDVKEFDDFIERKAAKERKRQIKGNVSSDWKFDKAKDYRSSDDDNDDWSTYSVRKR